MNENQVSNQNSTNTVVSPNNASGNNSLGSTDIFINTAESSGNSISTSIPPIAEVKIESSSNNMVTSEEINSDKQNSTLPDSNSNQSSNEPPKNNKVSTILLILLFIFLFAFIMGMPYINAFIDQFKSNTGLSEIEKEAREEEEKQKQEAESNMPTPTPEEEKTTELVCTSSSQSFENYTLVETQTFYYNSKNQILSSKIVSQYNFINIEENYNTLKLQCDNGSLKYLTHEGYTMACSYGENNIQISHEFDLKTFTPIIDGNTNIQANVVYQEDIKTVKTNLTNQGYICQ